MTTRPGWGFSRESTRTYRRAPAGTYSLFVGGYAGEAGQGTLSVTVSPQ